MFKRFEPSVAKSICVCYSLGRDEKTYPPFSAGHTAAPDVVERCGRLLSARGASLYGGLLLPHGRIDRLSGG